MHLQPGAYYLIIPDQNKTHYKYKALSQNGCLLYTSFGNYAPLQGWVDIYDSEGYCGGTFCSSGIIQNILPLILTGETKTYQEWYDYIYWKMRNFGFQSGQIRCV